jgi:hypothetical protein
MTVRRPLAAQGQCDGRRPNRPRVHRSSRCAARALSGGTTIERHQNELAENPVTGRLPRHPRSAAPRGAVPVVTQIIDLVSLTEVMIELNILGLFSVLARKAGDTFSRGRPPVPAQASEAVPGHRLERSPRGRHTEPPSATRTRAGRATAAAHIARMRVSARQRGMERRARASHRQLDRGAPAAGLPRGAGGVPRARPLPDGARHRPPFA